MKLPVQPRTIEQDRQARAPYNFVPLPEQVIAVKVEELPDQDCFHSDRLSGYLACELTTASPLYVRAGLTAEEYAEGKNAKDLPAFYYTHDPNEPVIPSSSLRGMVRALVEIVSHSKLAAVSRQQLVYRAVGDTTSHGQAYRDRFMQDDGNKYYTPLVHGGYIRQQGKDYYKGKDYYIQPAKRISGTTYAYLRIDEQFFKTLRQVANCKNAYEIYIKTGPYDYQPVRGGFLHVKYARVLQSQAHPGQGLRRATLARSGYMFSKRTEAVIFEADPDKQQKEQWFQILDERIDAYKEQLSQEQKDLLGDDGVLNDGQPVFYLLDEAGKLSFFGHARMFRIPYLRSPLDFVPPELRRPEVLDLTEALFGYTKDLKVEGKAKSYAGRLFFSDATVVAGQQELWLSPARPITPKILASPKPTTFQHYLVQTRPNKREIGRTRDDRPRYEVRLSDYAAHSPSETVIRGHKLYWHKGEQTLAGLQEPKKVEPGDTQHTHIQPLRAGVRFTFRIDFQNLSAVELGALLWVLTIAADNRYRLKLGMGKPLGMGAISITSKLFLIDRVARYQHLFTAGDWAEAVREDDNVRQQAVADFERFVLNRLDERVARRLGELERVRMLLALLSWPGPDPAQTRYMEIELPDPSARRGKRNEYDGRPVLPTPLEIAPQAAPTRSSAPPTRPPQERVRKELPDGYQRGTVLKFGLGPSQSFGSIKPDNGKEIFVHKSQLTEGLTTLRAGDRVIFRPGQGLKGPEAQDVRRDE